MSCDPVLDSVATPSVFEAAPSCTADDARAAGLRLPIVLLIPLYGVAAGALCSSASEAVAWSLAGGEGVRGRFRLPIVRLVPFDDGAGSFSDSETVVSPIAGGGEGLGLRFRLPIVRFMPFEDEAIGAGSSSNSDAVASSNSCEGERVGLRFRRPIVLFMPFDDTLGASWLS